MSEQPSGIGQPAREQWQTLLASALGRGTGHQVADPEAALTRSNYDGIAIKPLYTSDDVKLAPAEPGRSPFVRGSSRGGVDLRVRHALVNPRVANASILQDLNGGATSIWLAGSEHLKDLSEFLSGVDLSAVAVVLDAAGDPSGAASALLDHASAVGLDPRALRGGLALDPIAHQARSGQPASLALLAPLATMLAGTGLVPITVDATAYAEAGGGDADELAISISVGVEYVRALGGAGVSDPFSQLEFRYSVSAEQFGSIAKLRAARLLWSRIAELSGCITEQRQHAVTSMAMMTTRDPWLNMVRTTIGYFAAAAGGAQAITVLPFDSAIGASDEFARRIARNTAAIATDEAGISAVTDPAGGSFYLEALTEQLAERAWSIITDLDRSGGALAALNSGRLAQLLVSGRQARRAAIATRREVITGVSMFVDADELPLVRPPEDSTQSSAAERHKAGSAATLPRYRYAEEFEVLRERVLAHRLNAGPSAQVVLVTLGPPAQHLPRLGFARDLLAIAGIAVETVTLEDAEQGPLAGAVVCLCGTDAAYRAEGEQALQLLRDRDIKQLYVAGPPDSLLGADAYLYTGCDALQLLTTLLMTLGVQPW